MANSRRWVVKALAWNCFLVFIIWLICLPDFGTVSDAKRRGQNRRNHRARENKRKESPGKHAQRHQLSQNPWSSSRRSGGYRDSSARRKASMNFLARPRPTADARTERIRQAILTLPELSKLLDPIRHASNLNDVISPAGNLHLSGTVRRRRLYCRVGMGYHLEIRPNGKIVGRHRPTKDGILEIFSVKTGVVGVRGVTNRRYFCMNIKGKLYSSAKFTHECEFRERIEENNFNTYASNSYSNHETRTGYFMSLTKKGKSKKSKTVTARQTKAHWLPRSVND